MKFFSNQETGNALRITAVNVIWPTFTFMRGGWVGPGSDIPWPSVSTTNDLRWFTKWKDYLAHISVDCILWLTAPRFGAYKKRYINQECTVGQSHSPHPQNPKRRAWSLKIFCRGMPLKTWGPHTEPHLQMLPLSLSKPLICELLRESSVPKPQPSYPFSLKPPRNGNDKSGIPVIQLSCEWKRWIFCSQNHFLWFLCDKHSQRVNKIHS